MEGECLTDDRTDAEGLMTGQTQEDLEQLISCRGETALGVMIPNSGQAASLLPDTPVPTFPQPPLSHLIFSELKGKLRVSFLRSQKTLSGATEGCVS